MCYFIRLKANSQLDEGWPYDFIGSIRPGANSSRHHRLEEDVKETISIYLFRLSPIRNVCVHIIYCIIIIFSIIIIIIIIIIISSIIIISIVIVVFIIIIIFIMIIILFHFLFFAPSVVKIPEG